MQVELRQFAKNASKKKWREYRIKNRVDSDVYKIPIDDDRVCVSCNIKKSASNFALSKNKKTRRIKCNQCKNGRNNREEAYVELTPEVIVQNNAGKELMSIFSNWVRVKGDQIEAL